VQTVRWQRLRTLTVLLLAALWTGQAHGACPPEGSATDSLSVSLNRLKNRATPPARVAATISLPSLLVRGDDYRRWTNYQGGEIEGFVVGVHTGPIESCNCLAGADSLRDTHIELALAPGEKRGWHVVVAEVTPTWRKIKRREGEDWSTEALKGRFLGRRIRVVGWMLFDFEHAGDALNTAPPERGNARGTAWEIHPITSLSLAK